MKSVSVSKDLPCFASASREEALELLWKWEYGCPPPLPDQLEFREVRREEGALAGKAVHRWMEAEARWKEGSFTFPFHVMCPKAQTPVPGVVLLNFTPAVPDFYLPSEELCDLGLAVASFCYEDVSPDDGDFQSKLGAALSIDRSRLDAPGKLMLWAWAARLVGQYLGSLPEVDPHWLAVAGHSRLGKAALLAGALDPQFQVVFSNDSGCAGAALYRGKTGETWADIGRVFPFWFCPPFSQKVPAPEDLPFDQHFLLSLMAPRRLYVASAVEDLWADPTAEFRACVAASSAYEALGLPGLVCPEGAPQVGQAYHQGRIGYHLRPGGHFLSREDWRLFAAYLRAQKSVP